MVRKIEAACGTGVPDDSTLLVEGDWVSNHLLWREALVAVELLDDAGATVLDATYGAALAVGVPRPDLYVQLVGPPRVVLERIAARGRRYEQGRSFEQLIRALLQVDLARSLQPIVTLPCEMTPDELAAAAHERLRSLRRRQ